MNKVILIGNLARDPEIRYSQSAEPVAITRFSVACNRRFKRENEPDADFINCVSFGKTAEFVEKYFNKGKKIALTGRISVSSYEDNTGQRRWSTEVIAEEVEFAESKASSEARSGFGAPPASQYDNMAEQYAAYEPPKSPAQQPAQASQVPEGFAAITESIDDDDLPF